jgi:hypothetical protein
MAITLYANVEVFDDIDGTRVETLHTHLHYVDASDPEEVREALAGYHEDLREQGHTVLATWDQEA